MAIAPARYATASTARADADPGAAQTNNMFGVIHMNRLIPLVAAVLLSGCGDPDANAPMLKLNVKRGNGESVGRHRVSRTGVIAESGDRGPDGAGTKETITIDKIADDGVTLTITILDADGGKSSKKFLVPYDKEISVAVSKDATVTARLERPSAERDAAWPPAVWVIGAGVLAIAVLVAAVILFRSRARKRAEPGAAADGGGM